MIDRSFSSMNHPCTFSETVASFNNTSADDIQYGDMDEHDLLSLGLKDVSANMEPSRHFF